MRRPIAVAAGFVLLGTAACSDGGDLTGEAELETGVPAADLGEAVAAAQEVIPLTVPDSRVAILLEDLCAAGDVAGLAADVERLEPADAAQVAAVVAALQAGAAELCPDDVDPGSLQELAAAVTPTPAAGTATTGPDAASGGSAGAAAPGTRPAGGGRSSTGTAGSGTSGTSGSSAGSGGSASSASSDGTTGSAGDSTSGAASAGGGNATGTGNSSSTGLSQTVGGTSGASNSAGVGAP